MTLSPNLSDDEEEECVNDGEPYLWDGTYRKRWYKVVLEGGEEVICWPNAGGMESTDGSGRSWKPEDQVMVRRISFEEATPFLKHRQEREPILVPASERGVAFHTLFEIMLRTQPGMIPIAPAPEGYVPVGGRFSNEPSTTSLTLPEPPPPPEPPPFVMGPYARLPNTFGLGALEGLTDVQLRERPGRRPYVYSRRDKQALKIPFKADAEKKARRKQKQKAQRKNRVK